MVDTINTLKFTHRTNAAVLVLLDQALWLASMSEIPQFSHRKLWYQGLAIQTIKTALSFVKH